MKQIHKKIMHHLKITLGADILLLGGGFGILSYMFVKMIWNKTVYPDAIIWMISSIIIIGTLIAAVGESVRERQVEEKKNENK